MLRIAAFLALIGGSLVAGTAQAWIFEDQAPRPPADIPGGAFPPQPPPVHYPGPASLPAPSPAPPSAIQTQPLPPPAGAAVAPANAPTATAPSANGPPQQPAGASPQLDDTVVTEVPTQKIENGRAVFSGLDKITGRIISFDTAIGETVQFGALRVTTRACYTRPPTEPTNTDAFVEVDEVTLQGEVKRIFTGWMFALSPGLHAVEHPIYDVWLTDCGSPVPMKVAEPATPPAPAAVPLQTPRAPVRTRQGGTRQQTAPLAPAASPAPAPQVQQN
jgi:hypothetical protein